jgi:hypothetical protein
VRNSKLTILVMWVALLGAASACSSTAVQTPPVTRVATQTPWIIYVPVTSTSEPATVTPLPTVTSAGPLRTPTKAATKPPAIVPTKSPVPVVAASATAPPACNLGTVTLREPDNGASRQTREIGVGGDTFRFIWDPPGSLQGPGDPTVGYQLNISSQRNGATYYVSHNKFLTDAKLLIMDKPAVSALAGGSDVTVTWSVVIVKTTGSFNDSDQTFRPPGLVNCGSPSPTWSISLRTFS